MIRETITKYWDLWITNVFVVLGLIEKNPFVVPTPGTLDAQPGSFTEDPRCGFGVLVCRIASLVWFR